jgi:hypothetical protein
MPHRFIADMEYISFVQPLNIGIKQAKKLYIYETNGRDANGFKIKHTVLLDRLPVDNHFKISHNSDTKLYHICIDGDFVPYGLEKYNRADTNKNSDGRPDSLLMNAQKVVIVELKVEQEEASFDKEDSKWKRFFKGVTQIEDFVLYLKQNNIRFEDYFSTVEAVVCMKFEPNFASNTARNTERLKRSMRIGFPITAHNYLEYYQF